MIDKFIQKAYRAVCLMLENLARFFPVPKDRIRVHHGADPWATGGPSVKIQRMQKDFPDHPLRYNIIYTVSAKVSSKVCSDAKNRGVKIVQHINSLYNEVYRPNYEELNRPFKEIYEMADHIVFGSRHAQESAERFFGKCRTPSSIIYNSIDMSHFTFQKRPDNRFNVMVIGHYIRHRIEPLIRAMPYLTKKIPEAKLIIAGPLKEGEGIFNSSWESFEPLIRELKVDNIEYIPRFTQKEAPSIYAMGDIMVHIMHMDWTPNTVIESMACGLPVLHSGNGGLPEIIGNGGLSLDMPHDWKNIHSPEPELLAEKIIQLYEMRKEKAELARDIAVERYDLKEWISRHTEIFKGLFNGI